MIESWQVGVPHFRPRFPAWPAISDIIAEWGSKMELGKVTTEQGADEIGRRMEAVLSKQGYYDGKRALVQ
jgi:multiple sugar transport system substrate-binding protein